jgi:hypothetical protein
VVSRSRAPKSRSSSPVETQPTTYPACWGWGGRSLPDASVTGACSPSSTAHVWALRGPRGAPFGARGRAVARARAVDLGRTTQALFFTMSVGAAFGVARRRSSAPELGGVGRSRVSPPPPRAARTTPAALLARRSRRPGPR